MNSEKISRWGFLLGYCWLSLSGCTTIGDDFELENARLLKNGMTRDQVIATMGTQPSEVEGKDPGKLVWLYSSAHPLTLNMKRISVAFDAKGKSYGIPKAGIANSPNQDDY